MKKLFLPVAPVAPVLPRPVAPVAPFLGTHRLRQDPGPPHELPPCVALNPKLLIGLRQTEKKSLGKEIVQLVFSRAETTITTRRKILHTSIFISGCHSKSSIAGFCGSPDDMIYSVSSSSSLTG